MPHEAAPEVERGGQKRRGTPVPALRLGEQALCLGHLPELSVHGGQRSQRGETGPSLRGIAMQFHGLRMASDRLQERRPLRLQRGTALPRCCAASRSASASAKRWKVALVLALASKALPSSVAYQLLGQLRGSLVVGDAAKDVAAQGEQVDKFRRARRPRQAVDPRG